MTEHPPELVEKVESVIGAHEYWQRPDRTWECACGKGYGLKINLDQHVARAALDAIGLEPEIQTNAPVSVPTFDADGKPVMNDCGHQHHHSDWVDRERLVTPWVETARITGEQMRQRMDAHMAEVQARIAEAGR